MKRLSTVAVATALSAGLLGLAPEATAAPPTCPDAAHPIVSVSDDFDLTVGTKKVQKTDLDVLVDDRCGVDKVVAVVTSPRRTYRVTLTEGSDDPTSHTTGFSGTLRVDPDDLRNSDAGLWAVSYRVNDDSTKVATGSGRVRRATRVSFNAGPEPVRNNTITFSGKLERADWNKSRYRGIRGDVRVVVEVCCEEDDVVARFTTRSNGKYRVTQTFPGPDDYSLVYAGSDTTAGTKSRVDRVDAP